MNLLNRLHQLQTRHGWLPEDELRAFAEEVSVPLYRVQELVSFYPHFRLRPPPRLRVQVCRDAACHLQGAGQFAWAVREFLAASPDVEVHEVSCLGRCEHAPAAAVNDVPVEGWTAEDVVAAARGEKFLPVDEPTSTPRRWASDPYDSSESHYGILQGLLAEREKARATIPDVLEAAGLRGMGGAGFPTGLKWRLVRDTPGEEKWAVVNADESEPGTFKDRVILEELPHLVIEGLLIGCLVAGAAKAVVFIRHEYGREGKAIEREIKRVRARGILEALGVELELFVSPGGYILGEETALIEALEDKRGEPRNKPPYPVQNGVHGLPTLMNNVETFSYVPLILQEGAEAWRAHGVNGAIGWKFLSLCGHVNRPGVYCVPMGTTVRTLVEMQGDGMRDGKKMKAFSPGGASAPFLPASLADTPLEFDAMAKADSMLGSGAVLVVDEDTNMLDLAANMVRFFRNESCGKCVPCRVGTEKASVILDAMRAGRTKGNERKLLEELDETLRLTSICGLGQVALNPAMSVFRHFEDEMATPRAVRR